MTDFVIFEMIGDDMRRRAINPAHVINVVEEQLSDRLGPTCLIRMISNGPTGVEARRVEGCLEDVVNRLRVG